MKNSRSKVVLILGHSYSGSTLLSAMLNNHSQMFGMSEVYRLLKFLDPKHKDLIYLCSCDLKREMPCKFWTRVVKKVKSGSGIYDSIFDNIKENIIIDSTKDTRHLDTFTKNNSPIDPTYIVLSKSPEEYAASCLRYKKIVEGAGGESKYTSPEYISDAWANVTGHAIKSSHNPLMVKYEDLMLDTKQELGRICNHIGVDYEPGMENFWNAQVHHLIAGNDGVLAFYHEPDNNATKALYGHRPNYKENYRTIFYDPDKWRDTVTDKIQNSIWQNENLKRISNILGYKKKYD